VIGDAKQIPLFDQALAWLRLFMQFIRAPTRRIILKAAGIQGKFLLVQDGKWNTEVQSFLFYRANAAVMERVIGEQKWKPPVFRAEFNAVIGALLPMRTLVERAERGDTTLADFFVLQLACKAGWRRMGDGGNAIAVELLRLYEHRFATTADSLLHELAYVFTPDGHRRFRLMKQQCVAPIGKRTVSDWEVDVFAERLPKLTAKLIEMMTYLMPNRVSDDAIGRVLDAYLAVGDFWSPGESFRTGWQNKRNKAIWSKKLRCGEQVWENLRETAMIITQMPASEAAAERLFSVLQYAFKRNRASALLDILDATLAIRMWQIYHAPDEVGDKAPSVLRAQRDV
jgi:hypothetical protein